MTKKLKVNPKIVSKMLTDTTCCPYCGADIFVECRVTCLAIKH